MRAMRLLEQRQPLVPVDVELPPPGPHEVVVRVSACGVCRTDLHVVDGDLPDPRLPVTPGHEVVGRVVARGLNAQRFPLQARVGGSLARLDLRNVLFLYERPRESV
jgi:propanol-preferring alcohol dehydrogenase